MKITIDKATLVKSLSHVQSVVERRNIVSALSNVRIVAHQNGNIDLAATDMTILVTQQIKTQVEQAGELTVSAHTLFDIVRKLDDACEIKLEVTSEQPGLLNIVSGKSHFSLSTLPVEQFPLIVGEDFSHEFQIDADKLRDVIDKTKFAICTEETRYNLNGLHLHYGQILTAVAIDGHRLCIEAIGQVSGLQDFPQVIIPKKTIIELRKIIDESKGKIDISLSVRKIQFTCNNIILISKLIDAKFPDHTGLIPTDNQLKLKVNTKIFTKTIDRVATVTDEKFRGIKMIIDNDTLTLVASSEFGSRSEETIAVDSNISQRLEIGFNSRYLLEGVMVVKGEEVTLSLKDAFSSILIEDETDHDFKYILMPMRV